VEAEEADEEAISRVLCCVCFQQIKVQRWFYRDGNGLIYPKISLSSFLGCQKF